MESAIKTALQTEANRVSFKQVKRLAAERNQMGKEKEDKP